MQLLQLFGIGYSFVAVYVLVLGLVESRTVNGAAIRYVLNRCGESFHDKTL